MTSTVSNGSCEISRSPKTRLPMGRPGQDRSSQSAGRRSASRLLTQIEEQQPARFSIADLDLRQTLSLASILVRLAGEFTLSGSAPSERLLNPLLYRRASEQGISMACAELVKPAGKLVAFEAGIPPAGLQHFAAEAKALHARRVAGSAVTEAVRAPAVPLSIACGYAHATRLPRCSCAYGQDPSAGASPSARDQARQEDGESRGRPCRRR
jgi:hypothetical protein